MGQLLASVYAMIIVVSDYVLKLNCAITVAATTAPPTSPPTAPTVGTGGDPHFSIKLPSQKQLCYSIQGEQGYIFNLISNKQV